MELRMFEDSLGGTPASCPPEDIHFGPEEVLPVVSNVGEHSPEARTVVVNLQTGNPCTERSPMITGSLSIS